MCFHEYNFESNPTFEVLLGIKTNARSRPPKAPLIKIYH